MNKLTLFFALGFVCYAAACGCYGPTSCDKNGQEAATVNGQRNGTCDCCPACNTCDQLFSGCLSPSTSEGFLAPALSTITVGQTVNSAVSSTGQPNGEYIDVCLTPSLPSGLTLAAGSDNVYRITGAATAPFPSTFYTFIIKGSVGYLGKGNFTLQVVAASSSASGSASTTGVAAPSSTTGAAAPSSTTGVAAPSSTTGVAVPSSTTGVAAPSSTTGASVPATTGSVVAASTTGVSAPSTTGRVVSASTTGSQAAVTTGRSATAALPPSQATTGSCAAGTVNCPCNGVTCDSGLVCSNNVCIAGSENAESDNGASSDASTLAAVSLIILGLAAL